MPKYEKINFDGSVINTAGDFSTERNFKASPCRNSPTVLLRSRHGGYQEVSVPERRAGREYQRFIEDVCDVIRVAKIRHD